MFPCMTLFSILKSLVVCLYPIDHSEFPSQTVLLLAAISKFCLQSARRSICSATYTEKTPAPLKIGMYRKDPSEEK